MANAAHRSSKFANPFASHMVDESSSRPLPLRTYSESQADGAGDEQHPRTMHTRHKSTATPTHLARLAVNARERSGTAGADSISRFANPLSPLLDDEIPGSPGEPTPPTSPEKRRARAVSGDEPLPEILSYDFTKIDYELERARKLGSGLWSHVYLAEPVFKRAEQPTTTNMPTPPATPVRPPSMSAAVFAIKVPLRQDSKEVFKQEARMLTYLKQYAGFNGFVVPFYGLDPRNSALVFEAVIGGSLEDLINRMKQMTEVSRHQELVSIFPGIANDLISGLDFLHSAGVIHADIKPANVLLDISDHYSLPAPVIRARFCDFSASFLEGQEETRANAGGTWDYMAPEQLRIQKELNTPTFASDIWSLGISLLGVILLGSPYTAAAGGNVFMLREAVKSGDPLGFARMDHKARKRMASSQEFIDCCKLALQKDRAKRSTAKAWKRRLDSLQFDPYEAFVWHR